MSIKDTDRVARANYKRKITTVQIELYGTDADIKEWVESTKKSGGSVQGQIKAMIRKQIQNSNDIR